MALESPDMERLRCPTDHPLTSPGARGSVGRMRTLASFVVVACTVSILTVTSGCASRQVRECEPIGQPFDVELADGFVIGKTSIQDVEKAFGFPPNVSWNSEDGEPGTGWCYVHREVSFGGFFGDWFIPIPDNLFIAVFDSDGTLFRLMDRWASPPPEYRCD